MKNLPVKRLLILGGTGDAAELAAKAAQMPGIETISSFAGRTRPRPLPPAIPAETTRIGGFGGVAGLTNYLLQQRIDLLIDATHPFAAQISFNAAAAATAAGIPRLTLIRPAWEKTTGDRWIEVENYQEAACLLPRLAQRIFLSIGRQELPAFAHLQDLWFLMRAIDPPPPNMPIPPGKLRLERGPFSFEDERSQLQQNRIEAIVSKNSGGDATYAKIAAARSLGLPVVMVQRPPIPPGESASDLDSALSWLEIQHEN